MDCLRRVDQLVQSRGLFAAGFVSYEAAPAFDRALIVRDPRPASGYPGAAAGFPLVWFGLFAEPEIILPPAPVGRTSESVSSALGGLGSPSYTSDGLGGPSYGAWQPSVAADEYAAAVAGLRSASRPAKPIR